MFGLGAQNTMALQKRTSSTPWYADPAYALNSVLPSFIHDYAIQRYYNSVDGETAFPLTSVRTSNAMQFDSQGQLVWAPANLLLRSENLSLSWLLTDTTLSTDGTLSPSGSLATLCTQGTAGTATVVQVVASLVANASYTESIFFKPGTAVWIRLRMVGVGGTSNVWLNLATGAKGTTTFTGTDIIGHSNIVALPNGWYRADLSATNPTDTSRNVEFLAVTGNGLGTRENGATYYFGGAQLEPTGPDSPKAYNVTTSSAYYSPRFDYNPATLQPRGYLIEVQRTNSIRNNMLIGGVAGSPGTVPTNWSIPGAAGVTITTAYGVENGFPYIDVTYSGTNTSGSTFYPVISLDGATSIAAVNGQTWTHSAYVRKVGGTDAISTWSIDVRGRDAAGVLISGQSSSTTCTDAASLSSNRLQTTFTFTDPAIAFTQPRVNRASVLAGGTIDITIRFGGNQLEQGAFATSFIPTYGTAATRAGDVADLVTPPPYNPLGTTYYAEFERMGTPVNSTSESSSGLWFFGTAGATQVSAPFGFGTSSQIRVDMLNAGVSQCALADFATPFTVHKLCARIAPNDARAAYDATLTSLDTSVSMPASIPTTVMTIGRREGTTHQMHGWLRELRIYETAVPDGELVTVTT